ncbi:unnamed protein product [Aphanomyces euteiches]
MVVWCTKHQRGPKATRVFTREYPKHTPQDASRLVFSRLMTHSLATCRSRHRPDIRAIEFEDSWLTYGELNAQANAVAVQLAKLGVCVGSRVAVIMDRSLEFPIGLLAVLKVGATMMPLDGSFPAKRLQYMVGDASVSAIVTTHRHTKCIEEMEVSIPTLYIASSELKQSSSAFTPDANHIATRDNEAFIVYTSGSTGKPKGVPVLHAGAVNNILESVRRCGMMESVRLMQFMAIGFDGCQWEMWGALSLGGTLVLRSENFLDVLGSVDIFLCTPTALSLVGDPAQYKNLKCVAVAGEALPKTLKDIWCNHVRVRNMYGPSECAILSHAAEMKQAVDVHVGELMPNVNCFVVDTLQRQVPIGVVGEIYLSGIGVSPGYINLPKQTQERFVNDIFADKGGRMYRTGDLGLLLPNGTFEILGRFDNQVKLKGYRVELEEVAEAMMQHPQVVSAAAIVKDKTHLIGFYTPAHVDKESLHNVVSDQLPVYMVPAVWVGLDVMPMSTNDKIDKKALEQYDFEMEADDLVTENEYKLAKVWSEVLGVPLTSIRRQTTFFALGGDSISVITVVSACKQFGLYVSVPDFIRASILWRVAAVVSTSTADVWPSISQAQDVTDEIRNEWSSKLCMDNSLGYPVTPLQAGMIYATLLNPSAYVLQTPFKLKSMDTVQKLRCAFERVVATDEILRTTFVATSAGVYQVIPLDTWTVDIETTSASSLDEFLKSDYTRGFELGDKQFIRMRFVHIADNVYAVLTVHHALYDGWSLPMLLNDLKDAFYGATLMKRPNFRCVVDYVAAQDESKTQLFWHTYLYNSASLAPKTAMKIENATEHVTIDSTVSMKLMTTLAQTAGVTIADLAKLSWASTLRKYARRNDVVFGEPTPSNLALEIMYDPNRLSQTQAQLLLHEYDHTLTQVCEALNSHGKVSDLWEISQSQMYLIQSASFGEQCPLPYELLHHAFEERAQHRPDIRAIEFEDSWLTYGELNAQANAVAVQLAKLGVCVGSRVAVIMDRSLEFPIGLLAVLKVGATMMPLDGSFPAKRLQYMVGDASVSAIVTTHRHTKCIEEMEVSIPTLYIASSELKQSSSAFTPDANHIATRDNEAFIVYTSGSTGKPKGVPVLHAGAVNNIVYSAKECEIKEGMRVMQFMAIGFDGCQ